MAGTIFNVPFDEELFLQSWKDAPDPLMDALIQSGAVAQDAEIARIISGGGDIYTVPFWNPLSADGENLDGQTDITTTEVTGGSMTGCVYGRGHAFLSRDFTAELSGADPQTHIAQSVAKWMQGRRQAAMISTLKGVFGVTGGATTENGKFNANHTLDLSSATATAYTMAATDGMTAAQKALGDGKNKFGLALMHSIVATNLEKLQLLNFWTYTDANGMTRKSNIADWNGLIVVVDDEMPNAVVGGEGDNKDLIKYETYLLAEGALRYAPGPVEVPVEVDRNALTNGGQTSLVVRDRWTLHPNGLSFVKPGSGYTNSATNAQLETAACWTTAYKAKTLPFARIITNG